MQTKIQEKESYLNTDKFGREERKRYRLQK